MKGFLKKIKEKIFPYYYMIRRGNEITIIENGVSRKLTKYSPKIEGLDIFMVGCDNKIIIEKPLNFFDCRIEIRGRNNLIHIKKSRWNYKKLYVLFHGAWENRKIVFGENVSFFGPVKVVTTDSNSYVNIGDNTIISHDVYIYTTDQHTIIDRLTKKIINKGNSVEIGKNCWVGHRVSILKNVKIPDGTIVGAGAVVNKSFEKENTAVAGNPAKVIKENLQWSIHSYQDYINKVVNENERN